MQRKMLGALLLPIPFAALPVIVVLISAAFGPGGSDELVTREDSAQVLDGFAAADVTTANDLPLARASVPAVEPGCGDEGLRTES